MQGPQFLFAIKNKAGQTGSFVNGALNWNSVYTPLDLTPDQWQQLTIMTERNKTYFGLDISYGAPQDYVKSAASILKCICIDLGTEYQTYLEILEQRLWLDADTYGYYYDRICLTEIDLSAYVDSGKVTVPILQGEIAKYLKANDSNVYAINIDVQERVGVLMDGAVLQEDAQFVIVDPADITFKPNGNHTMGLNLISVEQKTTLGAQSTIRQTIDQTNQPGIFASKDYCLLAAGVTKVTATFDFAVTVAITPGSGLPIIAGLRYQAGFDVFDANGNIVNYPGGDNILYTSPNTFESGLGRHVVKVTKTFNVPSGSYLFPRSQLNVTNDSYANAVTFVYDNLDLETPSTPNVDLQYTYRFQPTICYGLFARDLFNYLIQAMTGGEYQVGVSALLDDPDLQILFTCGDALRQLVGSQIKISMRKFFQCINLIHGTGMGVVNNLLTIERKPFWLAPEDQGVDLGEAADGYKLYPATDLTFSSVKVGWPNQNYNVSLGDINGKYEICVTQLYDTPVTRVSTTLDLTTDCRADMYGAEFARMNLDGKTSVSDNADNDVFCLHVEKTLRKINGQPVPVVINGVIYRTLYNLDRSINPYVQDNNIYVNIGDPYVIAGVTYTATVAQYLQVGLLDKASAYNVALSPKQCLMRSHSDYLHSCLEKMDTEYLTFDSSDKNSALQIIGQPGGVDTAENANVQIATFKPPIFKCWYFEGQIISPRSLDNTIVDNPIRKYNLTYRSVPLSGTAMKSAIAPTDRAQQAYQILLAPNTDITPFKTIYE